MKIDPDLECDRALARRVQAQDQEEDRAALPRNCRDVVRGAAGVTPSTAGTYCWGIRGQDTQSPIVNSRRQDTESLVVGTGEER